MTCGVIARSQPKQSRALWNGIAALALRLARKDAREWLAAIAGFLLPFQTVWILRPGILGGVPWPLATIGLYASDAVLCLAAIVGFVWWWRSDRRRLVTACTVLVLTAALNTWVSIDPWLSAVGWLRLTALLLAVAGIPSWPIPIRRAFLIGFLLAMLGHVVLGFLQFATGHGFASTFLGTATHDAFARGDSVVETETGRWLRAYGGFPHPNVFGTALLVALIAFVRRPSRSFVTHYSLFIILTFALVLTFSRSALLGFIVLLIILAWRFETRRLAIVGAIVMVAAVVVTWSLWTPRLTATGHLEQRSVAERTTGVRDALALSAFSPFLGVGLHAMPQVVYQSCRIFNPDCSPYSMQPVHNVPLLAFTEIGAVGVLVFVLVWPLPRSIFFILHSSFFIPASLALLPPLLLDHFLWSLPIGLALVFVLVVRPRS